MHLTKGLYPFWDDLMTDHRFTDATLSVNKPIKVGSVFKADAPWEGNNSDFFTVIKDDDRFRMYYIGCDIFPSTHGIHICYAESNDGLEWVKPNLGIYEFNGSTENNIILGKETGPCTVTVMKDTNPDCPKDEIYKLFTFSYVNDAEWEFFEDSAHRHTLRCLTSSDGIHFTEHHICKTKQYYMNMFDSFNTVYWDRNDKKYYMFFRCTHGKLSDTPDYDQFVKGSRNTRVMTSTDCVNWSEGTPIDYLGGEDYELYTGGISPYIYDDRYYIGFPTRYNERKEWNASFEQLTGKDYRLQRMKDGHPRYGLTITDCVFMSSRDKYKWFRFDEACLTPGPEDGYNWEYGDCYPAVAPFETTERFPGNGPEITLLCEYHHWTDAPMELIRYVYRKDGFASYKATFKPQTLRTKPFTFDGNTLKMNFRTSARGYIQIKILDSYNNPIKGFVTCPHFGDTTERLVEFDRPLSELHGQEVKFEFIMSDAELFSVTFE